ncbi:hypothetical protein Vi05172_g610 [Venturia inaequalis]|nr:hypothetical protein Vi05172_g610 [Venturia inaequalis]
MQRNGVRGRKRTRLSQALLTKALVELVSASFLSREKRGEARHASNQNVDTELIDYDGRTTEVGVWRRRTPQPRRTDGNASAKLPPDPD